MGFLVDKVTLRQVFLRVLRSSTKLTFIHLPSLPYVLQTYGQNDFNTLSTGIGTRLETMWKICRPSKVVFVLRHVFINLANNFLSANFMMLTL